MARASNIAGDLVYPVADALEKRELPYIFVTDYGASGLTEPYRRQRVLQKPILQTRAASGHAGGGGGCAVGSYWC